MKKHLINILMSLAAVAGGGTMLSSCQDDLNVTPDGRMTIDVVFSTRKIPKTTSLRRGHMCRRRCSTTTSSTTS